MARKPKKPKGPNDIGKFKQMRMAFTITRKKDKALPWVMLGAFAADFVIVFGLGVLIDHIVFGAIFAVLTGILAAVFVFGSRVQKSAYSELEGQPGAAAAVLNTIKRGGWTITPMVALNKNQDCVHRAVGKAGIVLIAEGSQRGVNELLDAERRRMNRFVEGIPVVEIRVGNGEGEVPLGKLSKKLMRQKRTMKGGQVTEVNDRLRAVGDVMKNAPIPKGPMPKGARMPKGPRPPR
ncbi:MAG: DUF4191 domain-containing protein [Sporichthyaceae bacterium]